jgi:hypothetical protein
MKAWLLMGILPGVAGMRPFNRLASFEPAKEFGPGLAFDPEIAAMTA